MRHTHRELSYTNPYSSSIIDGVVKRFTETVARRLNFLIYPTILFSNLLFSNFSCQLLVY
jgi:hypothetical protein